ncbi:hypothetical protein [Leptospira idonii]|uniref:Uncharacterized protein n=1 Tax=Leptospira idonii TaxID=1193500 RepID=A0A4R9LYQ8_9LEPT|nr:hypothetical protein [Leptospira idonii]TGN19473.1 hypothetical protein EHS15_09065 [Leptospira idonii]
MNKELSEAETKAILEKIRNEYKEHGKLNPKAFDSIAFEKRYLQILQMRGNIGKFLSEEVVFLEQLKGKFQEIVAKKEAQKAQTLNRIMDESIEKLANYKKIDFHPMAKTELRYFYGAMADFAETELPVLILIFKGTPEYSFLQDAVLQIERIGVIRRGLPSLKIQELIKSMLDANGNAILVEKASQNLLKEGCLALKNIYTSIQDLVSKNRINPDLMANINERDYPKAYATYGSRRFEVCLNRISEQCKQIIQDFRMNALMSMDN